MLRSYIRASALFTALLVLSACNSDNGTGPQPPIDITTANLVGQWKLAAATVSPPFSMPGGGQTSDFFSVIDDCDKDNILVLNGDSTYERKEGAVACDPPTDESGDWILAGTKLILADDFGFEDTQTVVQVTAGTFTATAVFPAGFLDAQEHTVSFVYARQGGGNAGPPAITAHPQSVSVAVGGNAAFSVTATGTAPLSYQWMRNGSSISGARQPTYTLPNVSASDHGAVFSVLVSNSAGSVISQGATLSVGGSSGDLTGNWKITAATVNPGINLGGTIITDFYALMENCKKDDIVTLNADGSYVNTEGVSKCDPADPDIIETGTWSLTGDRLTITPTGQPSESITITRTANTFTMIDTIPAGEIDSLDHTTYATYTRQ